MRAWAAGLALLALLGTASADRIRLKNGTSITADKVTEKGDMVEYTLGATRYSVPKAAVSSIERGGSFGVSVGAAPAGMAVSGVAAGPSVGVTAADAGSPNPRSKMTAPRMPLPQVHGLDTAALLNQITTLGRVDNRGLYKIESAGDAFQSAVAYFLAARFEYERGEAESARRYMKRSVGFAPEQTALLEWYTLLLLDAGQYGEAVVQAEAAAKQAPRSADALQMLGLTYYNSGRHAQAVKVWQEAQKIEPSEAVAYYLDKAQREGAVEENFNESESAHFALRYEGRGTGFTFRADLLRALDRQYNELARDLGFAPDATITVILYTEQQFFDVTQAPAWAGGLNDGKLRIPVRNVSGMTPELEAVLKHELTHSFVHWIAHTNCPTWLTEGLAQLEEPRSSAAYARELGALFHAGKHTPLRALETSFVRLPTPEAHLAYAESLAVTEYLRSAYGMNSLRRMLQLLGEGEEPEAALREATQANYARVEGEVGAYLAGGGK